MNKRDIAAIIAARDGISMNEAYEAIDECQEEILNALNDYASYDDIADIIEDYLGLEPDYMDAFLM